MGKVDLSRVEVDGCVVKRHYQTDAKRSSRSFEVTFAVAHPIL
jgi:hypothetical protein